MDYVAAAYVNEENKTFSTTARLIEGSNYKEITEFQARLGNVCIEHARTRDKHVAELCKAQLNSDMLEKGYTYTPREARF